MKHLYMLDVSNDTLNTVCTNGDYLDYLIQESKRKLINDIIDKLDFNVEIIKYSNEAMRDAYDSGDVDMVNILKKLRENNSTRINIELEL